MARPINQQLHQARSEEILASARAQLADEGLSGFSLRAVARRMELAPNALYTYFPCLDDLITALLIDAFQRFFSAIKAADSPDEPHCAQRFQAVCMAYRAWATAHPTDYDLIFGRPIPGYQAPDAITSPLSIRAFEVGLQVLVDAARAKQLQIPARYAGLPAELAASLAAQPLLAEAQPVLRSLMLTAWSRLHGLVTLEIHGNAREAIGDGTAWFAHNVTCLIAELGFLP
jgi:AcrR family transcriptional regulator